MNKKKPFQRAMWAILITLFLAGCGQPLFQRVRYACPSRLQSHATESTISTYEMAESYTGTQFDFGTRGDPSPDGWTYIGVSKDYIFDSISIAQPNTPGRTGNEVEVRCTYRYGPHERVHIKWDLPPDSTCKIDNSMQRVNGGVVNTVAKPYTALCLFPASSE